MTEADIRKLEQDLDDAKDAQFHVMRALTRSGGNDPEIVAARTAIRDAERRLNSYVMKARHAIQFAKGAQRR